MKLYFAILAVILAGAWCVAVNSDWGRQVTDSFLGAVEKMMVEKSKARRIRRAEQLGLLNRGGPNVESAASLRGRQIAKKFCFSSWGGKTKMRYAQNVAATDFSLLSLPTNGLNVNAVLNKRESGSRLFIYEKSTEDSLLNVEEIACQDVLSAHRVLLGHFELMQTTRDYSSSTNDIGDRGYSIASGVLFVRNNLFVRVLTPTNSISAEAIARQIDADILRKSMSHE